MIEKYKYFVLNIDNTIHLTNKNNIPIYNFTNSYFHETHLTNVSESFYI